MAKQKFLHQRLINLRKSKNLTQEDVAHYCHCSVRSICVIENGKVNKPIQKTIAGLSKLFSVDMDYWFDKSIPDIVEPKIVNEDIKLDAGALSVIETLGKLITGCVIEITTPTGYVIKVDTKNKG